MKLRRAAIRLCLALTLLLALTLTACDSDATPAASEVRVQPAEASPLPPQAMPDAATPVAPSSPPVVAARKQTAVTLTPLAENTLRGIGFNGDVWGYRGFAYVGTWGSGSACPATGVKIIDLADPTNPQWVATAAAIPGTSQEDMVVRSVSTAAFSGDLMAVGIQRCGGGGRAGMALWDVTDPRTPVELGFFESGARGVHELDLVQQGERVLAVLAIPDSEVSSRVGDFRIVDVSDPRRPLQLSDWGIRAGLGIEPGSGVGCTPRTYDHSARASRDGQRAYLSYWDAGVIVLDISTPTAPRLLARLPNPEGSEGATHSVSESADGRLLLVTDEDDVFRAPLGLRLQVQTADGPRAIRGCESTFSKRLDETGVLASPLADGGTACPGAAVPDAVRGMVAVVRDDGCTAGEKAARLAAAGAAAMVIGVAGGPTGLGGGGRAPIPVVAVSAADATLLRGSIGMTVTLPSERRWSGVRVWDIANPAAARELSAYQSPGSVAFPAPTAGYYTAHNSLVVGDLAFVSWYSDGVRVLDISNPAEPREVAAYVPPPRPNGQRVIFPDGAMVWGVFVLDDLVLLSDVNGGLTVLRWGT